MLPEPKNKLPEFEHAWMNAWIANRATCEDILDDEFLLSSARGTLRAVLGARFAGGASFHAARSEIPCRSSRRPLVVGRIVLCAVRPLSRSITDRVARSLVVNIPPPQPHRAPAVPTMYSAPDAEFGPRPQTGPDLP